MAKIPWDMRSEVRAYVGLDLDQRLVKFPGHASGHLQRLPFQPLLTLDVDVEAHDEDQVRDLVPVPQKRVERVNSTTKKAGLAERPGLRG